MNDQASGLRKMKSSEPVKVIAVSGGKGGVGKTNVSLNTAIALGQLGQRVLVLDADLGLANVDVMLGLRVKRNLSHVLSGECELDSKLNGLSWCFYLCIILQPCFYLHILLQSPRL